MQVVEDFFLEIDRHWTRERATKIRLSVIGCGALLLQADYQRGTKDSDVFETVDLRADTKQRLLHRVERDMLGVAESEIELPSWI